jgi:hypothetical protein
VLSDRNDGQQSFSAAIKSIPNPLFRPSVPALRSFSRFDKLKALSQSMGEVGFSVTSVFKIRIISVHSRLPSSGFKVLGPRVTICVFSLRAL